MSSFTTAQKITIGQISQYLAGNDIEKSGLFGGGQDLDLPRKLYMIRKNVEWLYNLSPSDSTLTYTSNYLYALCGRYGLAAQNQIVSGGSIAPALPNTVAQPYDFQVTASTSISNPLKAGDSAVVLTLLIGYNIEFTRNNLTQNTTNLGDGTSYYSWNSATGLFQIFGAASLGELFRILPSR